MRSVQMLLFDIDEEDAVATGAVLVHISHTHTKKIPTFIMTHTDNNTDSQELM